MVSQEAAHQVIKSSTSSEEILDKLLWNIKEYQQFLGFLKDKHPTVLEEWKNKAVGPQLPTTTATGAVPTGVKSGNYDR